MLNKNSNKTFFFNGLEIKIHPEVYEPSEDTFQMIETIKIKENEYVLELGTGCGIISFECARNGANVICSDINPYAIKIAQYNYKKNQSKLKGNIEIRYGDLFNVVKQNEKFNVVLFNPPYLPTKPNERIGDSGWFDKATDGGIDGLEIINRFIMELSNFILKDGEAYFIFSSLANREKLENIMKKKNIKFKIASSKIYYDERLDVYCLYF